MENIKEHYKCVNEKIGNTFIYFYLNKKNQRKEQNKNYKLYL